MEFKGRGKPTLMPTFRVHVSKIRLDRQQALLDPIPEAQKYAMPAARRNQPGPRIRDAKLWQKEEGLAEAKRRAEAVLGCFPTEEQYLGQLVLQFGQYQHKTLQWLLSNIVGHVK